MRRISMASDGVGVVCRNEGQIASATATLPELCLSYLRWVFASLFPCHLTLLVFRVATSWRHPLTASAQVSRLRVAASLPLYNAPAESAWLFTVLTSPLSTSCEKGASAQNH